MLKTVSLLTFIFCCTYSGFAQKSFELNKPDTGIIECTVQPFYRHRPDGKPGREITVNLKGINFSGKGTIELECEGQKQVTSIVVNEEIKQFPVLFNSKDF
jgi:hypothetical protein